MPSYLFFRCAFLFIFIKIENNDCKSFTFMDILFVMGSLVGSLSMSKNLKEYKKLSQKPKISNFI